MSQNNFSTSIENIYLSNLLIQKLLRISMVGLCFTSDLNSTECQKYYLDNCRRLKRTNTNFGTREIKMKASGVVSHFM